MEKNNKKLNEIEIAVRNRYGNQKRNRNKKEEKVKMIDNLFVRCL